MVSRCRTLKLSDAIYAPDNEPFTVASLSAKQQGLSILRKVNKFLESDDWATRRIWLQAFLFIFGYINSVFSNEMGVNLNIPNEPLKPQGFRSLSVENLD
jgi:hypothetical protein